MHAIQGTDFCVVCKINAGYVPLGTDRLRQRRKFITETNTVNFGAIANIVEDKCNFCFGVVFPQVTEHLLHCACSGIGIKAVCSSIINRYIADCAEICLTPNIVDTAVKYKEVHIYIGNVGRLRINSGSAVKCGIACTANANVIGVDTIMFL